MTSSAWIEDTYARGPEVAPPVVTAPVVTAATEEGEDVGELEIADYLVFLFALDTYMRYIEESSEVLPDLETSLDIVLHTGIALLRVADKTAFHALERLLREHLTNRGSLKMLDTVMKTVPTARGAAVRALRLRTILSRGGTATARAVFGTSTRARREVMDAIEASMMEDSDAALTKFAAITLRNKRVEKWIDQASAAAVPLTAPPINPVQEAAKKVTTQTVELRKSNVTQAGVEAASEESATETTKQGEVLRGIEEDAREAAQKSLRTSGEEDRPLTKSEVVGVAAAVVAAQAANPENLRNVPPSFINDGLPLDPEQQTAALTDGRVLVAAGAGAGKSTTLVSRIAYLIQERNVSPNRIMAVSFNRKAADELIEALHKKLGDTGDKVSCDTMHALFKKFITGDKNTTALGSWEEQLMLSQNLIAAPKEGQRANISPSAVAAAIRGIWKDCGPAALANFTGFPEDVFEEKPKSKKSQTYISRWQGNDVSLDDAKTNARSKDEQRAAVWYNLYLGVKGDLGPKWRPPCGMGKSYENFMKKYRPGGERLGDMDDMLKVLRDILRRKPDAKKMLQGAFDHILVDEAQDLNTVQHQIFEMLSEHIAPESTDKSIWMVGDDKQAIYQFRGAKPKLFQSLKDKPGWKMRMIRTNYRCPPEVIEHANKLISFNEDRIPMDSQPSPYRKRGEASILVSVPPDNASAAISKLDEIRKDMVEDPKKKPADYAVLARTNAELNDFETACIINETPYIRRGGRGFLDAPETKSVLGYMDLAVGTDYAKMRKSLAASLLKPDRGLYLKPDDIEKIVEDTFDDIARIEGVSIDSINPNEVLGQRQYARMLADNLKKRFKLKIVASQRGDTRKGEWLYNKFVDGLTEQVLEMGRDVTLVRGKLSDPGAKTMDLLESMLDSIKSTVKEWDPVARREIARVTTLRDQISNDVAAYGDDEDDDESASETAEETAAEFDEEGRAIKEEVALKKKGLGAIQFLFELAKQNPNDLEHGTDPESASGFQKKLVRYEKLAATLRIDPSQWAREQKRLSPDKRGKPPAVTLSTVHCSPPDEPILTTGGWIPIGNLDPAKHRLASYAKDCNQLRWGNEPGASFSGFPFVVGSRPYSGDLITVQTAKSKTRITPNHRVMVRFSDVFMEKYVVYLMRRGDWWRVGVCISAHRPYRSAGVGGRLATEQGDAAWILGVLGTREEALMEEARIQGLFGIPGLTFEAAKSRSLTSTQLHEIHDRTRDAVAPRAGELLAFFGLEKDHPLYSRGEGRKNLRSAFLTRASNLLSGYMEFPVVTENFIDHSGGYKTWFKPEWQTLTVSREKFGGEVFSLTVMPHRFYVSGGAVVHNSVKGAQWKNVTVLMPKGKFPLERKAKKGEPPPSEEEMREHNVSERNLGYVALTRAIDNLEVVALPDPKSGDFSPFLDQAGLHAGENVPKPEIGEPGAPEVKTADYDPHAEVIEQLTLRLADGLPDLGTPTYGRV